jgi:hypothetical protein
MSEIAKKKTPSRKPAAKKKVGTPAESPKVAPARHDIELMAYQLWVKRGRQHGEDTQDWKQAEEILRNQ